MEGVLDELSKLKVDKQSLQVLSIDIWTVPQLFPRLEDQDRCPIEQVKEAWEWRKDTY